MEQRLVGRTVAVLLEEGFEDLEFWVTVMRLREEGAAEVIGTSANKTVRGKNALQATSDVSAADVSAADFDAVVVPGRWAPDKRRRYEAVTSFVREAYDAGKIVGLICHAGLVDLGWVVDGHRATGSLGIRDDLVNAGATWADEAAFRDGNLVWGRVVEDIPALPGARGGDREPMTLHGATAAAATPFTDGATAIDAEALGPLVAFLAEGGMDGVLACGTTGEGVLLSAAERRAIVERFLEVPPRDFQVAVHAGAQTTAETVELSAHAAGVGADAVAVIARPTSRSTKRSFHALPGGGRGVRTAPAVRVRVRRSVRLRDPGLGGRAPPRAGGEPRGTEGERHPVREGRAVPARGAGRVRGLRAARARGHGARRRRRGLGSRDGLARGRRRPRPRLGPDGARAGERGSASASEASRSTPR